MADYKKRKELKEYLPHSEHWKLKSDRKSVEVKTASSTVLPPLSPHSETAGSDTAQELKRNILEEDEENLDVEETKPSSKKCKYENGDNEIMDQTETESSENVNGKGEAA